LLPAVTRLRGDAGFESVGWSGLALLRLGCRRWNRRLNAGAALTTHSGWRARAFCNSSALAQLDSGTLPLTVAVGASVVVFVSILCM